ncbi:MAG: hypothetical protein JXA21_07085 [Anaerolineae bacterium]|nr:hypothetical protein [Anaerolineae bacterium]
MYANRGTPWHKASYDAFLNEHLPAFLGERLPLLSYTVEETGVYTCCVTLTLPATSGEVSVSYDLPQPDADGRFKIGDGFKVALPHVLHENGLHVNCVGEWLLVAVIGPRFPHPPTTPFENEALVRAWCPLDKWIGDFLETDPWVQPLDTTNWLAEQSHLRSLKLMEAPFPMAIASAKHGRVCPFETPEGPLLGQIVRVALGAEIQGDTFVVNDTRPEAALGMAAAMVPFLEHDDPNHLLMGANMLRQWVPQQAPEPALVQTGYEPSAANVWNGRNLLTAFVSWGAGTFESGLVVSESCARRFDSPYPLQVGDKLSNRHGTKGVVSQILPDAAMPHLRDGTPVDIVFTFAGLHRQLNFGQIREAVMGRIARHEGRPAIVAPFAAPTADELRARLRQAGLPESGMETLSDGKDGPALAGESCAGPVYWGRLVHLAQDKLHVYTDGRWGQVQGEMENFALRDVGAFANIRENLNTRSIRRPDAASLGARLAHGPVEQSPPPTPVFADLTRRLRVAGIAATLSGDGLSFCFAPPETVAIQLAHPVPHPWLPERSLSAIGAPGPDGAESDLWSLLTPAQEGRQVPQAAPAVYRDLVEANERLARMLAGHVPQKLLDNAVAQLEGRVRAFFDALFTPAHLRLSERSNFSGRAVLVPGAELALDQVGLPEEIAWALFGPLAARALDGDAAAVAARSGRAAQALDAVMARAWVIVNRAPTVAPTALLAFHPRRVLDNALHFHPLLCEWFSTDFDGDQAAVMLPVSEAAQREAGEKLSVAGHLARDPGLLDALAPAMEMAWGLAKLSLDPDGLAEITRLVGEAPATGGGFVSRAALAAALRTVMAREGIPAVMARLEALMERGFAVARASGASLSPFAGTTAQLPSVAQDTPPQRWPMQVESVIEALAFGADYTDDLGPQRLMVKAVGRGLEHLAWLVSGRGLVNCDKGAILVSHGYVAGYTSEELFAAAAEGRRGLEQMQREWEQIGASFRERNVSRSFNVLPRALRAKYPGVVFARAAANGERDSLTDVESRMVVGLPVERVSE